MAATRLVAVRHAKPEGGGLDHERALTAEGREIQQAMAEMLQGRGITADLLLTSPLIRAVQTAEILQQVLGGELKTCDALGNVFDGDVVLSQILPQGTTFLVGHDPTLAAFVNHLLGEVRFTGFAKSCAAVLDLDSMAYGSAKLVDYLTPEL